MKNKVVLTVMVFLALVLGACSSQSPSEIQIVAVELSEIKPSAEVVCWGSDESGNGFKEWVFIPAIEGTWEEMPVCESGALSVSWSNSLVETDDNWVWSGVISKLEQGYQLGSITCDGTEQGLHAYKAYNCTNWSASYAGVKISSDPLVFVPTHP